MTRWNRTVYSLLTSIEYGCPRQRLKNQYFLIPKVNSDANSINGMPCLRTKETGLIHWYNYQSSKFDDPEPRNNQIRTMLSKRGNRIPNHNTRGSINERPVRQTVKLEMHSSTAHELLTAPDSSFSGSDWWFHYARNSNISSREVYRAMNCLSGRWERSRPSTEIWSDPSKRFTSGVIHSIWVWKICEKSSYIYIYIYISWLH